MSALLPPRSTKTRQQSIARLQGEALDLLVVGGGITGVAVARDAVLRGLRVAVIEQDDFAAGTSSRSSRVIHGGLRYLAGFDLPLVRQGLVERRRLLRTAPGLVRPVRFLYPVYNSDPDPLWKVTLGVFLYESLALGHRLGGKRWLGRTGLRRSAPGLRHDGLRGGVSYFDAATHDTRLTLSVAKSAEREGAILVSRCRAESLLLNDHHVSGVQAVDLLNGERLELEAHAVALCCGPWQTLYPDAAVGARAARSTHISLPGRRVPLDCFATLRSPRDGRLVFAIPVRDYVVLGMTDEHTSPTSDTLSPTSEDTEHLLEVANSAFPAADLQRSDIRGAWAASRPLLADSSHIDADDLSRRHNIVAGPPGLWVLSGGILPTHRRMAQELVDAIAPHLEARGADVGPCLTESERLLPGSVALGRKRMCELGFTAAEADGLAGLYGARLATVAERLLANKARTGDPGDLLQAQIEIAIEEEWALSLDDLLVRRIGPGALDLAHCIEMAQPAAAIMARCLGWSKAETEREIETFCGAAKRDLDAASVPL